MPVLAFALLVWVIHRHGGVDVIVQVHERVGWNWPLLVIPVSVIAVLTILAYRVALPGRGKEVPLWPLIQIERSGTALNSVLPLGNNSSHIVKIGLLRHWYSTEEIASAGVWCAVASGASNVYTLIGPLVCLAVGFGEPGVVLIFAAASLVMSLPMVGVLLLVGKGLSARVTRVLTLVPLGFVQARKEKMIAWAQRLDKHVAAATAERRADFALLMFYRFSSQAVRVGEIWLAVELLKLPGGIYTALLYNALNRAVLQLFVFIPGRIGVMEFASAEGFAALGLSDQAGLELALVLRFRFFVKVAIGYTALASLPGIAEKYPPPTAQDGPEGETDIISEAAASSSSLEL
jgi:hypothetical protein